MTTETGGPDWRGVPGIPHIEVSDSGEIRTWVDRRRSLPRLEKPRLLKASFDGRGYRIVCIRGDQGSKKTYRLCRLILRAFVGEPAIGMQACHGNNVKSDDRIVNLRWDTASGNTTDQVLHGVHRGLHSAGEAHPGHKLKLDQVVAIKQMIAGGATSSDIAKHFGVPRTTVNSIKIGRSWRSADAMLAARTK